MTADVKLTCCCCRCSTLLRDACADVVQQIVTLSQGMLPQEVASNSSFVETVRKTVERSNSRLHNCERTFVRRIAHIEEKAKKALEIVQQEDPDAKLPDVFWVPLVPAGLDDMHVFTIDIQTSKVLTCLPLCLGMRFWRLTDLLCAGESQTYKRNASS